MSMGKFNGKVVTILSAVAISTLTVASPCDDFPNATIRRAYYINKQQDTERNRFMRSTLALAGILATRVPAVEPPVADILQALTEASKYSDSEFFQQLFKQRVCAKYAPDRLPKCFSPTLLLPTGCFHLSAYGTTLAVTLKTTSVSRRACGGMMAHALSYQKALRQIKHDLAKLRRSLPRLNGTGVLADRTPVPGDEQFVLLLEDDSGVLPDWRPRFCRFLRDYPPHTWDIAKVDIDAGDRLSPRTIIQRSILSSVLPPRYTAAELEALRADPIKWREGHKVNMARVPHVMGLGAVLLRERAVPTLLDMLDSEQIGIVDWQVAAWAATRDLRVAIADDKLCDSDTAVQSKTTIHT